MIKRPSALHTPDTRPITSMKLERFLSPLWLRSVVLVLFLVSVNLISGILATKLNYPSLYNVHARFSEYAVPLPFHWALAHIPSMLIFGIPLLFLHSWKEKHIVYFRAACILTFLLLLLEFDRKIPFLLFLKVDTLLAFICSLVVAPPNKKDNPTLSKALKIATLSALIIALLLTHSVWKHRTPSITKNRYMNNTFSLQSIVVNNDFRKEMVFEIDLRIYLEEKQACSLAQILAVEILRDYPFDNGYQKSIELRFTPNPEPLNFRPYALGEISLNEKHKDASGLFACSLQFRH